MVDDFLGPFSMDRQPDLKHQDYTEGWICALPVEAAAGKAMLDEIHPALHQAENDHNKYTLGSVGLQNIVHTCLPAGVPGTKAITTVAIQMLRMFTHIKVCLMVGVGGGILSDEHDIRLGMWSSVKMGWFSMTSESYARRDIPANGGVDKTAGLFALNFVRT